MILCCQVFLSIPCAKVRISCIGSAVYVVHSVSQTVAEKIKYYAMNARQEFNSSFKRMYV